MKADYILTNGKIYKSNQACDIAEAVAIAGSEIICAGSIGECEAFKDENTIVKDLKGRLVLPGLIDGHTHPETIAKSRWRVTMPYMEDKEILLNWIKEFCKSHPADEVPYILALGYPATMFDENGPTKEELDAYTDGRPVRIQDYTDHACWYNSKALELMEITKDIPDDKSAMPYFVRNDNGEPTGWCLEPIMNSGYEDRMFEKIGWYPPKEVTEETLAPFLNQLKSYGVIGIVDGFTDGENGIKTFCEMDRSGRLNMYYDGMYRIISIKELDEAIRTIREWQNKYTTDHVRIHTIKLFLDQTNEMGTGASLEPHRNDPEKKNYGHHNMDEDELTEVLTRLNDEKIDLHVHVVCDRAFRTACNAYERAKASAEVQGKPWNIFMELAHCELVHPDDMKRPAQLGIILNWSCHWAGGYFGTAAIDYLGRERWDTMYDFRTFIDSGAVVTYSSDVIGQDEEYRADPYFGMEISARRVDLTYPLEDEVCSGGVRTPVNAKLTVKEMVRGYTADGAIPLRREEQIGTIEAGKKANLVVLDKAIFEIPDTEIHTAKAEMVMFEGKVICGKL